MKRGKAHCGLLTYDSSMLILHSASTFGEMDCGNRAADKPSAGTQACRYRPMRETHPGENSSLAGRVPLVGRRALS